MNHILIFLPQVWQVWIQHSPDFVSSSSLDLITQNFNKFKQYSWPQLFTYFSTTYDQQTQTSD